MRNARLRILFGSLLVFVVGTAVYAQTPPSADQVFRLRVASGTAGAMVLNWTIAPGNYLYRDKIVATTSTGSAIEVTTDKGEIENDPSFGQTEIYRNQARAVLAANLLPQDGNVVVTYQGCAEKGICYPPIKKTVDPRTLSIVSGNDNNTNIRSSFGESPIQSAKSERARALPSPPTGLSPEQARLDGNIGAVLLAFVGFGLLLAFTPCVFPMIPILSGMLARSGDRLTARRGFVLSGAYVLAMALAYAVLGVVVAWSGQNLQAALQTPVVLVLLSAVFLALAVSMFGYYDLQIPQSWQTRLTGKPQQNGSLSGAAIMGFGSALVVGPCVTPPLAAALVYVAQTGDVVRGAAALFALGLGMGLPLLAFGTFGAGILPKSGPWLANVKHLFGFVFIGLAIWIASRILPNWVVVFLWAAVAGSVAVYLATLIATKRGRRSFHVVTATTGVLVAGVVLVAGSFGDSLNLPLGVRDISALGFMATAESAEFKMVKTPQALDEAIARAVQAGRPVVIDFSAEWCVECHVMDRTVFSDPIVRERLRDFDMIRADATDYNDDSRLLMKRFGVVGPPTVIFLDADEGVEAPQTRIIGPVDSATFLNRLNHLSVD